MVSYSFQQQGEDLFLVLAYKYLTAINAKINFHSEDHKKCSLFCYYTEKLMRTLVNDFF